MVSGTQSQLRLLITGSSSITRGCRMTIEYVVSNRMSRIGSDLDVRDDLWWFTQCVFSVIGRSVVQGNFMAPQSNMMQRGLRCSARNPHHQPNRRNHSVSNGNSQMRVVRIRRPINLALHRMTATHPPIHLNLEPVSSKFVH